MEIVYFKFESREAVGFFKSIGAFGGVVGGLILLATGLFLSTVSAFRQTNFRYAEMCLFLVSLALLAIGAHSFDLIERDKKNRRNAPSE